MQSAVHKSGEKSHSTIGRASTTRDSGCTDNLKRIKEEGSQQGEVDAVRCADEDSRDQNEDSSDQVLVNSRSCGKDAAQSDNNTKWSCSQSVHCFAG